MLLQSARYSDAEPHSQPPPMTNLEAGSRAPAARPSLSTYVCHPFPHLVVLPHPASTSARRTNANSTSLSTRAPEEHQRLNAHLRAHPYHPGPTRFEPSPTVFPQAPAPASVAGGTR
ncbi:hypothetical protein C8J57DRAFT_1530865 [Mycena rebaudengoi]|nr:hypothetical protein C8J57DRAFT_1530865 [Mycena rebaudengoi]